MGILDMFIINQDNIGKGFQAITKGTKYIVAYNEKGKIIAYTSGISAGKQLLDKYIEDNGLINQYIKFEEEFHKKKDGFINENESYQVCIVDKKIMLKRDVKELMKSVDLVPNKNNKMMSGVDVFTSK